MKRIAAIVALCFASLQVSAETVPVPAQTAFKLATIYLVDLGAVPSFRDTELLMLRTDPLPTKLTKDEADCGSMFGIAYLKDSRVKTAVSYVVSTKGIDDTSSTLSVRVSIEGYMDVNEGAPFFIEKTRDNTKVLNCKSIGVLEKRVLDAVLLAAQSAS